MVKSEDMYQKLKICFNINFFTRKPQFNYMKNNFTHDLRKFAPATERNREPILEILQQILPSEGRVLEIASGSGQHAVFFAPFFPNLQWYPSDCDGTCQDSIQSWINFNPNANLKSPLNLDVSQPNWWLEVPQEINVMLCINMIHIAPWSAFLGLMEGAKELLSTDGILYLYGPYQRNGKHTAPSNAEFDRFLRLQNSQWGVRHLEEVISLAEEKGFKCIDIIVMPANNLSVVLKKSALLN